jgi:hypothetical protein
VLRDLKTLGTVQSAETKSEDVTAQRVDLDARIKALQASLDRLLAIMRDAKDPDALIKAEGASPSSPSRSADRHRNSTRASSDRSNVVGMAWFRCWAISFCYSAFCCHGWERWPLPAQSCTESSAWRGRVAPSGSRRGAHA